MSLLNSLRRLLVATIITAGLSGPAIACLEIPPDPPDFWVVILGPNDALIIIHDFTTYGATQGSDYCACALNVPAQHGTVVSATLVDSATGQPLPGFSFGGNTTTANGFQAAAPLPPPEFWSGFSSAVSSTVAAGIPVDIVFHVTNPERLNGPALAQHLSSTSAALATDAADANGNPQGPPPAGHQSIQPANSVAIQHQVFGLTAESFGQATLDRSGGQLVVSNIGSSGKDGVSFSGPPSQGAAVEMSPASCANPSPGRGIGLRAQNIDSFFDIFYEISIQDRWQAQVSLPSPPVCMQVQVFDPQGELQLDECVPQGQPLIDMPTAACFVEMAWLELPSPRMRLLLQQPQPIQVGGSPVVVSGSEIHVFDPAAPPGSFDTEIISMSLRSAPDSFFDIFIEDVFLQEFDNLHGALGGAVYVAPPVSGQLVVSNIGSSGLDGVRALPPSHFHIDSFFDVWTEISLPPPPDAPIGSFLQFSATGPVHNSGDQVLGHVTILKAPDSSHVVSADFSPVGSSTTRIEVYNDGTLVHEVDGLSGDLASYAEFPASTGKLSSGWPPVLSCFVQNWPNAVSITVNGPTTEATVQGDELRILAEGGTPVDGVSSFSITGADQESITLTGEVLTPASDTDGDGVPDSIDNCVLDAIQCDTDGDGFGNACDGDLDGNNIVNSFDLGLMRQSFGQTGASNADLDCNGTVNSFDLTRMRALFGTAPGPSGLAP